MKKNIRFANNNDCNKLAALSTLVWLEAYGREGISELHSSYVLDNFTPSKYLEMLDSKAYEVLVAEENDCLVGLAVINLASQFETPENGFELERLYIHSSFRKLGYGRAFFKFIISEIGARFWLYTWVHNDSNAFYERLGFNKIGEHSFQFGQHLIENNVYAHTGP